MTLEDAQQAFTAWRVIAAEHQLELRAPPPVPTTCCGKGCAGCVWESFFDAVQFWLDDAQALLSLSTATIKIC